MLFYDGTDVVFLKYEISNLRFVSYVYIAHVDKDIKVYRMRTR